MLSLATAETFRLLNCQTVSSDFWLYSKKLGKVIFLIWSSVFLQKFPVLAV